MCGVLIGAVWGVDWGCGDVEFGAVGLWGAVGVGF